MPPPRTVLLAACIACTCKPTPATTPAAQPDLPSAPPVTTVTTPPPADTPPPPTEPTAETPPQFPATVYASYPDRKTWIVAISDLPEADTAALEKRLTAEPESTELELPIGDPTLPPGFAIGDPWTLITRTGCEQQTATGFSGVISGGSGTLFFTVRLGPAAKSAKGPVLAVRGPISATAKLITPAPVRPSTLAKTTLPKTVEVIDPHLEPEIRAVIPKIKFTDKHLKLYPGRFPGGRSHVGFLAAKAPGEENATLPISGIVFAYPDGRVEFFAAAVTWGTATMLALVDIDGDGLDEILYDDTYFEGGYVQLIHWKEGRPFTRTLTGDGL